MKYAIILETLNKDKYLLGFTNTPIMEEKPGQWKYTVELTELNNLFIRLEGDAAAYLKSFVQNT